MRRTLSWMVVAAGLLFPGVARADSLASLPDPGYADPSGFSQSDPVARKIHEIVYPTSGFPSLVVRGGTIPALVALDDGGAATAWEASITTSADPLPQTYRLSLKGVSFDSAMKKYRLDFSVPSDIPRDVYDFTIRSPALPRAADTQLGAVRVIERFRGTFTFVHISDSHMQDIRTPDKTVFAGQFPIIRFLDPEFVVFSGDISAGANYPLEYEENHATYAASGLCVFKVPGNHDGYSTVTPTAVFPVTNPPGRVDRDGLESWREVFGPLHYAFDYGDQFRFIAINSMGGEAKRRNSVGIAVLNYGGQVDPPQLSWVEQMARDATAQGRRVVLFSHHDPRGPYTPNVDAYPFSLLKKQFTRQQWNDESSAKEILRVVAETNVTDYFIGHDHVDDYAEETFNAGTPQEKKVKFAKTTTFAASPDKDYIGFRYVRVDNGRIAEVNYDGMQRQHIPFGNPPHLRITEIEPNDGSRPAVTIEVANDLAIPVSGVLKFHLARDPRGYSLTGGTLRDAAVADNGGVVAYVETTVASKARVSVHIEPAAGGFVPTIQSSIVPPANRGGRSSSRRAGSIGFGGCISAPVGVGAPLTFLPLLPLASLLFVLSARRRR